MQLHTRLTTERLALRALAPSDAAAYHEAVNRPEISDLTISLPHPYLLEWVEAWIETTRVNFDRGKGYEFAITLKETERFVGAVSLWTSTLPNAPWELGYWIRLADWGRGYATEAAKRTMEFGFLHLDTESLRARCLARNVASIRVLEKLGFSFVNSCQHEIKSRGRFEEVHFFSCARPS